MYGSFIPMALIFSAIFSQSCLGGGGDPVRYNDESDGVLVEVTGSELIEDPVTGVLHSTTGVVEIGSVEVSPSAGPVGTEHRVVVQVLSDYSPDVGSARVTVDSDIRGTETFDMVQDSADAGVWVLDVTSAGTEGEARQDWFAIALFAVEEAGLVEGLVE